VPGITGQRLPRRRATGFTRLIDVAPMLLPDPGRQQGRLRIRGRLLTRIQEGVRHRTGHVATFEKSAASLPSEVDGQRQATADERARILKGDTAVFSRMR
jgi:hypothetical protein